MVLLVASAVFSWLLNRILLRLSVGLGSNRQSEQVVRWASTSKPTIGGISFFITFLLASVVYFIVSRGSHAGSQEMMPFLILLGVVTLGFLIGLHDDAFNTRPLLKFSGQMSCAIIMIAFNQHIQLFDFWPVDYFLTILWVVGIMNSINLLDNMDAVTGTVSLVILVMVVVRMLVFDVGPESDPFLFASLASIGAIFGFLVLNWHPSKIYMGDTGSQFLGALLAMVGARFFWNFSVEGVQPDWITRTIAPVLVFIVPIMDTSFVTVARIMRGQSPFVGGKDHLTHNMTYVGVAQQHVPMLLGLVSLGTGALALFGLRYLLVWSMVQTALYIGFMVVLVGVFYLIFKKGERIGLAKHRFGRTLDRVVRERNQMSEPAAKTHQS
jgi:UDP-GlcNAc:undecaprenyl-phosphate GlcNAc-1-phosphate transferase